MSKVKYSLQDITIENFRGIRKLKLSLTSDKPAILIGPNNAGKSSLLDALGIAMCSPKFLKPTLDPDDFWIDANGQHAEEFDINVTFVAAPDAQLPAVKGGIGDPVEVSGIKCRGHYESLSYDRVLIDRSGSEILLNRSTPVSKTNQDKYKGMGLTGKGYARTQEIHKWLPEVWQLDPKNLFVSLYEWKTGPLQQLLKLYKEKLFKEKWEVDDKHKMPEVLDDVYGFLNKTLKTPFWENELSPKLASKLRDYLGKDVGVTITPGLSEIDAWILSQFLVRVSPESGLSPVDVKRLGDGWQSLFRLATLEVVLELVHPDKMILLLIEEPETYLHPHLRRKIRLLFKKFQNAGHQVVCATHSQELISFAENQHILRLSMRENGVELKEYSTEKADQAIKDEEKLGERGNHEMVFARKVILTEGKADRFAVHLGMEKQAIDIDTEGLSIIDCGGVGNLPGYAQICSSLGIPWFAIHDKDTQTDGSTKENTKKARAQIDSLITAADKVDVWSNDLEEVIGYMAEHPQGKVDPIWISQKWGQSNWDELKAKLQNYTSVLSSIQIWVGRPASLTSDESKDTKNES